MSSPGGALAKVMLIFGALVVVLFLCTGPSSATPDSNDDSLMGAVTTGSQANLCITNYALYDMNDEQIVDVTAGHTSYAQLTIMNEGGTDASTFRVICYIDSVEFCNWDVVLGAGGVSTLTTLPFMLSSVEMHTMTFALDTGGQVVESNETDNQMAFAIWVVNADWTLLIYMDADNNLEPYMIQNFLDMASVGSSSNISIVVQMDRIPGYDPSYGDWTGCYRFLIGKGMEPLPANALMDMGEVNMGDGATFASFLEWGVSTFQADRYIVVLKDHGASWYGACFDDTSGDRLSLGEMRLGLNEVVAHSGEIVDLVLFDDCLMGSIEVATEFIDMIDYAVVSETVGWTNNFVYSDIITYLAIDVDRPSKDVAIDIVTMLDIVNDVDYDSQSVAAYDMKRVSELRSAFDEYSVELYRCFNETPSNVQLARSMSDYMLFLIGAPGDEVIDLHQFVTNSLLYCGDAALSVKGHALLDLLGPRGGSPDSFIVKQRNTSAASFCHGMSIYFPIDADRYDSWYLSSGYFGSSSVWHLFLPTYLSYAPPITEARGYGTLGDGGWYITSVTMYFSTTDTSGSGIAWTRYSLDGGAWTDYAGPFVVGTDGEHAISYRSMDNSGNLEDVKTSSFRIDRTDPSISASVDGFTVTLHASDANSGVSVVYYCIDLGEWKTYTDPFVAGMDGWIRTVEFFCIDAAGNSCPIGSITVGTTDAFAPKTTIAITGTEGFDGWYVGAIGLRLISMDDGGSGLKVVHYRIGDGPWSSYSAPLSFAASGTYTIRYCAEDNYGNIEPVKTFTFKVDVGDPSVEAIADGPGSGIYRNGTVSFSLNASDDMSGTDAILYRLNGGGWTTYVGAFSLTEEGTYMVEYFAKDHAGNSGDVQHVKIVIDLTDPVSSIVANGLNDDGWGNGSVSISMSAVDEGSGVAAIIYRIDEGGWTEYSDPITFDDEGTFLIECYAVDGAGNIGPMTDITCRVDMTAPSGEILIEGLSVGGDYVNSITLNGSFSDEGSGLFTVIYRLDNGSWESFENGLIQFQPGEHVLYYYAVDKCGNVGDVIDLSYSIIVATGPGQVTDLVIDEANGMLVLSWSPPDDGGLEGMTFSVYRSIGEGAMELIATVDYVNYVDGTVEKNVDYRYRVVAVNPLGEGEPSSIVGRSLAEPVGTGMISFAILGAVIVVAAIGVILVLRRRG